MNAVFLWRTLGILFSASDSPSQSFCLRPSILKASRFKVVFYSPRNSLFQCRMANPGSSYVDSEAAEIIVVRHGETAWNSDGRIQGHLDVELNDVGRQQAAAVADRLSKERKISFVYSSDLKRALDTAQSIATKCEIPKVIKDSNLRERHLGDLQGLVLREAARANPQAYQAFMSRNTDKILPGGGESLDQLYERCTSCLQDIGRKHRGERVVVVTHGGVIRSLYKRACPRGRPGGKVLNTSINVFHLFDGDKWTIKSWGDVTHLHQTPILASGFGGDQNSGDNGLGLLQAKMAKAQID